MKKYIIFLFFISIISIYGYNSTKKSFSDVLMTISNIDALAGNGEVDMEGKITCYSSFSDKDSGSNTVKDCGTCRDADCTSYWDSGKCRP